MPDDQLDSPYLMLGGREPVQQLAERFYDVMERDEPGLAALHRRAAGGRIDAVVRERFALFLVGWLGGPQEYAHSHGHPRLRMRHARVPVDQAMRDAWVRCMTRALDECGVSGRVRVFLEQRFGDVASFLRNVPDAS